jgi:hypothetical protein
VLDGAGWWMPRPSSLHPGKTQYQLYRLLGGPQGRFGWVQKNLPQWEFSPWTVQPIASHYTNYSILAHFQMQVFINIAPSSCSVFVVVVLTFWVHIVNCRVLLLGWIGPYPDEGTGLKSSFHPYYLWPFSCGIYNSLYSYLSIQQDPTLHAEYLLNRPPKNIPFSSVHLLCMFVYDATSLLFLLALYLSCLLRPFKFFQPLFHCEASFLCHCWCSMDLTSGFVALQAAKN